MDYQCEPSGQRKFYEDINVTSEGEMLVSYPLELTQATSGISETTESLKTIINDLCMEEINRPRPTMTCGNPPPPHPLKLKRKPITKVLPGFCRK